MLEYSGGWGGDSTQALPPQNESMHGSITPEQQRTPMEGAGQEDFCFCIAGSSLKPEHPHPPHRPEDGAWK